MPTASPETDRRSAGEPAPESPEIVEPWWPASADPAIRAPQPNSAASPPPAIVSQRPWRTSCGVSPSSASADGQVARPRVRGSAISKSALGIGSPCGSMLGFAEVGGDQLLELAREDMLEHLGLVVDAVPRHPERLGEELLDQAVAADDPGREGPPAVRRTPW